MTRISKPLSDEQRLKRDMERLNSQPEFQRFLLRVIQSAGLFDRTADGSNDRHLVNEGRRNLGLDILDMAEQGQPLSLDDNPRLPLLTLFSVLREEIQKPPQEKTHEKYDRTAELDEDDDQAD